MSDHAYSNSSLATYTRISPNKYSPRDHKIDTISIHCAVGQFTAKEILDMSHFATADGNTRVSCNYAIGKDGSIGLGLEEKDGSWCTSSYSNDNRAITIEVASDTKPPYAVKDEAYKALIDLCEDICRRNGIKKLLWKGDKSLIGQVDKQNMTVHRWFSAKECPGDYLYNLHGKIAEEVNARLISNPNNIVTNPDDPTPPTNPDSILAATSITYDNGVWIWPVKGYYKISSDYGNRTLDGITEFHKGIDIAAPLDTPILAVSSGVVINSGPASGYGNWIRIDHGTYTTTYGHMSTLNVKEGERVNTGDIIAYVGSEGRSTGPHLHFQVNHNMTGDHLNPLDYVSPDKDTHVSENYDYKEKEKREKTDRGDNPHTNYAGGTTVGQRVSGVTTQPIHAFFNVYIRDGTNTLTLLATDPIRPNVYQSFRYDRKEGAGEKATFVLFDDNWDEIERILSKYHSNVYIEYGYPGTGKRSKLIRHNLAHYTLEFLSTGTILTVQTTTHTVKDNIKPMTILLDTYNPTEAVKEICRSLGYKVLDENFEESKDVQMDNPFNMIEDYPITYIKNVIIPQASQENEELFTFEVDSDKVAYFKREKFDTTKADNMRTYIINKGYDSSVIDFSLTAEFVFGGAGSLETATGYKNSTINTTSKDFNNYRIDKSQVVTEASGDITTVDSKQSDPLVDGAGFTPTQMKNKLYYSMKSRIHDGYKGTLKIVGDPTIDFINDRYIRIINVKDDGILHHSSGVYMIDTIIDEIEGGQMTTTLQISKQATYGDIQGVEILNPKFLIK